MTVITEPHQPGRGRPARLANAKTMSLLAELKADGYMATEAQQLLADQGVKISIHWLRRIWTSLPRRRPAHPSKSKSQAAQGKSPLTTAVAVGAPIAAMEGAQPNTVAPAPARFTPAKHQFANNLRTPKTFDPKSLTVYARRLTKDEALKYAEYVIRKVHTPDFSSANLSVSQTNAFHYFADLRSQYTPGVEFDVPFDTSQYKLHEGLLDKHFPSAAGGLGNFLGYWLGFEMRRQKGWVPQPNAPRWTMAFVEPSESFSQLLAQEQGVA